MRLNRIACVVCDVCVAMLVQWQLNAPRFIVSTCCANKKLCKIVHEVVVASSLLM